ncbi:MAG: zinc ribbon domain-containing protein [Parvibaculum sp.]|nr:zinc ribbon domain-containing protein [Parvibaculum sp.]
MIYLLLPIVLGLIPAVIAREKGRSFGVWWLYGALLWIVAFPHSILLSKNQDQIDARAIRQGGQKCPHCAEIVRRDARVCRFCGGDLTSVLANDTHDATVSLAANDQPSSGLQPRSVNDAAAKIGLLPILGMGALVAISFGWFLYLLFPASMSLVATSISRSEQARADAAENGQPSRCSAIGDAGAVKFLACEPGSTAADWRAGGISACGARTACNVWIWDDEKKAAKSIPMTDAEINAAVAVWVHAQRQLNDCGKDGC